MGPACCRAMPARESVPGREYEALIAARESWGVTEAGPPISTTARQLYGNARKGGGRGGFKGRFAKGVKGRGRGKAWWSRPNAKGTHKKGKGGKQSYHRD